MATINVDNNRKIIRTICQPTKSSFYQVCVIKDYTNNQKGDDKVYLEEGEFFNIIENIFSKSTLDEMYRHNGNLQVDIYYRVVENVKLRADIFLSYSKHTNYLKFNYASLIERVTNEFLDYGKPYISIRSINEKKRDESIKMIEDSNINNH